MKIDLRNAVYRDPGPTMTGGLKIRIHNAELFAAAPRT